MTVPPGAERGPLRCQLVHRQAGPDALVAAQLAGRGGHRDELAIEPALVGGAGREPVAAQGELVLAFPADPVALGHVLRRLPQADRRVQLLHPRAHQPPAQPGIGQTGLAGKGLGRAGQHEGGARHRLHAARQADVGLTCRDRPGGARDRLHAGPAQPVHGCAGDLHRQARQQHPHPRHVPVVLARLVRGAPVDVVDPGRVQPGVARQQRADHLGRQVVGPDRGERALDLPHRGPACVDNENRRHVHLRASSPRRDYRRRLDQPAARRNASPCRCRRPRPRPGSRAGPAAGAPYSRSRPPAPPRPPPPPRPALPGSRRDRARCPGRCT